MTEGHKIATDKLELTHDSLFAGKLVCCQHRNGYRFSVDAVLLAHFIHPARHSILDLGAGSGVISLILAYRNPLISITCLELQNYLSQLIKANIAANGLEDRLTLLQADLRKMEGICPGSFDYVVCNPPYYKLGSGRKNPGLEQSIARHEVLADQKAILAACNYAVRTKGKVALIYPAERAATLLANLKLSGLEPKRVQAVYPYPGTDATHLLIESVRCGGEGLTILEPFYIYNSKDGGYSAQMQALYND
nr:methyltransferase [Desulfobulbaceae bacterium]